MYREEIGTNMTETDGIDFVIPWVDGSDPEWKKDRDKWLKQLNKEDYSGSGIDNKEDIDGSEERYRDWGLLKYLFRGINKFTPWVRKVHFITYGHLPEWMDTECPKLHIVRHEDYIPEKYLPVFNCNVLETRLQDIKGLAEKFIYINDDIYFLDTISPTDFFKDGKPKDMLAFQPLIANPDNPVMSRLLMNNMLVLSKYFRKRENVRKHPGNYFKPGYPPMYFFYNLFELAFPQYTGLYTVHGPSPFLKETYREVWACEEQLLTEMASNKFRCSTDVTQYLFREWQKLKGNFSPFNVHKIFKYFELSEDNSSLFRAIENRKKKIICINDANLENVKIEQLEKELQNALQAILPEKSMFEK